jgi:hypothetical protein
LTPLFGWTLTRLSGRWLFRTRLTAAGCQVPLEPFCSLSARLCNGDGGVLPRTPAEASRLHVRGRGFSIMLWDRRRQTSGI